MDSTSDLSPVSTAALTAPAPVPNAGPINGGPGQDATVTDAPTDVATDHVNEVRAMTLQEPQSTTQGAWRNANLRIGTSQRPVKMPVWKKPEYRAGEDFHSHVAVFMEELSKHVVCPKDKERPTS